MMFKRLFLVTVAGFIMLALQSCKREDFSPSIPAGTKIPVIIFKGYTIEAMQVRIGPRSVVAGVIDGKISAGKAYEVPFAQNQGLNRVVFYKEDGSVPFATSQINFTTPDKDTTIAIFYDGKTFFKNPIFPVAGSDKMLMRVTFKSKAIPNFKSMVDLELHAAKSVSKEIIDPKTGEVIDIKTTITINPAVAKTIKDVKPTEFSDYVEVPAFDLDPDPNISYFYVIYFRSPGTKNPLPYPSTNVNVDPYAVLNTTPGHTGLIIINDARVTAGNPDRIIYEVDDAALSF